MTNILLQKYREGKTKQQGFSKCRECFWTTTCVPLNLSNGSRGSRDTSVEAPGITLTEGPQLSPLYRDAVTQNPPSLKSARAHVARQPK